MSILEIADNSCIVPSIVPGIVPLERIKIQDFTTIWDNRTIKIDKNKHLGN